MPIRKILFFALILAGCIAPSIAQSPQVPRDSRTQIPSVAGTTTAQPDPLFLLRSPKVRPITLLAAKGNSVCYTIRSYNFEAVDPASGITKLKGITTCEPSNNTQLKGAAGVPTK